jgi:hypothetical protein
MSPYAALVALPSGRALCGGTLGWWRNGASGPDSPGVSFLRGDMSNHIRPTLLGYIRADALSSGTELPRMEAELQAFADTEEFSLGTVYVEQGETSGAFHALMTEMSRDEAARGVVVPDLRHLTVLEQLVLSRHEDGARTAIFAASIPSRAGGPGVKSPNRARPAVPPLSLDGDHTDPHLRSHSRSRPDVSGTGVDDS